MRPAAHISATFVALTLTSPAAAEEPPPIDGFPVDPSAIYGGETSAPCGWPTTVSMEGACTGTLVHPQVVVFAAHCGSNYDTITFGESIQGGKRHVATEFCRTFPGGQPGNGKDFAFCKLAQPQTDIPIVPILLGCETEYLQPGQPVTIVGFGNADNGPYGIKREVVTTINQITGQGEAFIGGGGKDSCQGDSGGPVYLQLDDGTWRVFGVTSYGGACGTGGYYSMIHNGIQWFEEQSGIDLTPCWDASTNPPTWAPTPACKDFPIEPGAGGFDWGSGCAGGPLGQSMSCGPLLCQTDAVAPTVQVDLPANDTELSSPNQMDNVLVTISATAADQPADCYVKEVRLLINDNEVGGTDPAAPYEFVDVSFPTGVWQVSARAVDYFDNQSDSEPVQLCINMPCPEPPDPTTGTSGTSDPTGSGTGGGSGTGEGTEGTGGPGGGPGGGSGVNPATVTAGITAGDPKEDEGCECRSGQDPKVSSLLLVGLAALGLRRRRRAAR